MCVYHQSCYSSMPFICKYGISYYNLIILTYKLKKLNYKNQGKADTKLDLQVLKTPDNQSIKIYY